MLALFLSAVLALPAAACELVLEQRLTAPFHVTEATAVALGDAVLVAGGAHERGAVGDAWVLGADLQWTRVEANLTWRRLLRGAVLRDEVLLADGQGAGKQPQANPVTTVEGLRLGPPAERRVVAQAPGERYRGGAAAWRGELWLAGGHDLTGAFRARVDVLDPETGRWRRGPDLAEARDTVLVVVAGRLLALGGATATGSSLRVERLDQEGTAWEARAAMPAAIAGSAVAAVGEEVFVFGDAQDPGRVWRYDSHRDRWSAVRTDASPRTDAAAAALGDRIVVVGGASGGAVLDLVEVYTVACGP